MKNSSLDRAIVCASVCALVLSALVMPAPAGAQEDTTEAKVEGTLVANGETVELPYVYVWREPEGFYDESDPTWKILFTQREVEERDLDGMVWDAAFVEVGLTETAEFGDAPELQVYTQSLRLSAETNGNISGGSYPQFEIEGLGTDRISGRVYHTEEQEFLDDTYSYDFTFSAPLSDPNAPIGDLLPAGGGEPGAAYQKWIDTVHAGDLEALKAIVPAEMGAQLDEMPAEDAAEHLEFMRMMTPTEIEIVGGSTDGQIAILEVKGQMEGETVDLEVTMTKMGDFWVPTGTSM